MLVSNVLNGSHIILPGFFFSTTKGKNRDSREHMYEQLQIYGEQYFRNGPRASHSRVKTVAIVSTQDA